LVGIGHQDKPATLTYLNSFGLLNPEAKYRLIGSGSRYAKTFLERIWNRDMTMAKVAEIGYFVIKYIEELKLDRTVGLDTRGPLPKILHKMKGKKILLDKPTTKK
jgi:20S proteasome alpha/beta subunit